MKKKVITPKDVLGRNMLMFCVLWELLLAYVLRISNVLTSNNWLLKLSHSTKGSEDCYKAKIRIILEEILDLQFLVTDFGLDRCYSIQLLCNVHKCCIPGSKATGA
jgi:hypothetical protein